MSPRTLSEYEGMQKNIFLSCRPGLNPVHSVRIQEQSHFSHIHFWSSKILTTIYSFDHRCGLGIMLPVAERARVRSPVGLICWLRFLRFFFTTLKQMSGNLGHIRPRVSFGHHPKSYSPVYGRQRSQTLHVVHESR